MPRSRYQRCRSSIQYSCHSSSVPGSTKNSISICSNSRIRKMKLPGVISLRNDLPICAMPNGTFFRLLDWICAKSTNMPWAVSGRRYTAFVVVGDRAHVGLEHQVEVARVGEVAVTAVRARRAGVHVDGGLVLLMPGLWRVEALEVVGAEALVAVQALDERVREHLEVPARLPDLRRHDDRRVEADHVVAELDHRAPPGVADVPLQLDAERPVVPRRAQAAVDLAGLERDPPAFREGGDGLHEIGHGHRLLSRPLAAAAGVGRQCTGGGAERIGRRRERRLSRAARRSRRTVVTASGSRGSPRTGARGRSPARTRG